MHTTLRCRVSKPRPDKTNKYRAHQRIRYRQFPITQGPEADTRQSGVRPPVQRICITCDATHMGCVCNRYRRVHCVSVTA